MPQIDSQRAKPSSRVIKLTLKGQNRPAETKNQLQRTLNRLFDAKRMNLTGSKSKRPKIDPKLPEICSQRSKIDFKKKTLTSQEPKIESQIKATPLADNRVPEAKNRFLEAKNRLLQA